MAKSDNYIVTGTGPEVLECLDDPATMGVIWRGAFSREAREAAHLAIPPLAQQRFMEFNRTEKLEAVLSNMPELKPFDDNLKLLRRFLTRFTDGNEAKVINLSRVELHQSSLNANNGALHVDPQRIVALGVPDGVGPQYLVQPIPGHFDRKENFFPEDREQAESMMQLLPNDALLVMKGKGYDPSLPYAKACGLPHRRSNRLIALSRANRLVVQFGM